MTRKGPKGSTPLPSATMTEALCRVVDENMRAELEEFYRDNRPKVESVRGACQPFSVVVANHCGLTLAGGSFELDRAIDGDRTEEDHWWCVDGTSRIVDLTASQFNAGLNYTEIAEGVTIVNPEDPLYKRYKPREFELLQTDEGFRYVFKT